MSCFPSTQNKYWTTKITKSEAQSDLPHPATLLIGDEIQDGLETGMDLSPANWLQHLLREEEQVMAVLFADFADLLVIQRRLDLGTTRNMIRLTNISQKFYSKIYRKTSNFITLTLLYMYRVRCVHTHKFAKSCS